MSDTWREAHLTAPCLARGSAPYQRLDVHLRWVCFGPVVVKHALHFKWNCSIITTGGSSARRGISFVLLFLSTSVFRMEGNQLRLNFGSLSVAATHAADGRRRGRLHPRHVLARRHRLRHAHHALAHEPSVERPARLGGMSRDLNRSPGWRACSAAPRDASVHSPRCMYCAAAAASV